MRSASSQISRVSVRSSSPARLLEQLRGAADAGERVLDLVRQHGGERDHRARRAAMGELAVHLVGDGALLQHDHDVAGPLRHRRDVQVDEPFAGIARRAEIDLVFVHGGAAAAHLLDQREQRAAERHEVAQRVPAQQRHRDFEEMSRPRHWRRRSCRPAPTMMTGCGSALSTASAAPVGNGMRLGSRLMPRPSSRSASKASPRRRLHLGRARRR